MGNTPSFPWPKLPPEIQNMILDEVVQLDCNRGSAAAVSKNWQAYLEPHIFSRLRLTPLRLAKLDAMTRRNRKYVRYLWFCIELPPYTCENEDEVWPMSEDNNALIMASLQSLFCELSGWQTTGPLTLDISVYSPSDAEHWFKYLTFLPDLAPAECAPRLWEARAVAAEPDDPHHNWIAGRQIDGPPESALLNLFQEIMGDQTFGYDDDHSIRERQWWQQLPEAPAVTNVILRQQNRRSWDPMSLMHFFDCLPGLEEIHYEPWRSWSEESRRVMDVLCEAMVESLSRLPLKKLVIFEDFCERYKLPGMQSAPDRVTNDHLCGQIAEASVNLEKLSASFIVDASSFFEGCQNLARWPNLTSLVLTSRLFRPEADQDEIDDLLVMSANTARKMPKLQTMEIWNGRQGLAALFRYDRLTGNGQSAMITWRGTWQLHLPPVVLEAWKDVALKHGRKDCTVHREVLDADVVIKSHGDALHALSLAETALRPVSLAQIRYEQEIRDGAFCSGIASDSEDMG